MENLDATVIQKLFEAIGDLKADIQSIKKEMESKFSNLDRKFNALERAPTPYGRPREFHGGLGAHSVAGSTEGLRRYSR